MSGDRRQQARASAAPGRGGAPDVPPVLEQEFDTDSLYALRSAVSAHAAAVGLPPDRVHDVMAAAHELAANAIRHGAGHGRLRLQASGGVLTCQVSDAGPAAASGDAKPGAGAAPWPAPHGHGLWLVGELADQLSIDRNPAGTTATFTLGISQ